ncbi:hypothetical protein [Rossellomorea aquimaris]|uniref:hypothetical protein n=1 Tax=Rossellomorea aquimaris TaxID=189382 RepID=UPI0011E8FAFC|nr:hypothetical protein [Rossellomorea aquimaris]TYS87723.1 hypothetical protein FZC88_17245 [Rossellomorea aquimaris]
MDLLMHLKAFFTSELFLLFFTIIATGIGAAETRMALELLHIHQKFNLHLLDEEDRKWILKSQFRLQRYKVGIATSFLAIISLARELDHLNQSIIGLIASLSGINFLSKQIDGNFETAIDAYLQGKVDEKLFNLQNDLDEIAKEAKDEEKPDQKEKETA